MPLPDISERYRAQVRYAQLDATKQVQKRWKRYVKAIKRYPIPQLSKERWYDITYPKGPPAGSKTGRLAEYSARSIRMSRATQK